MLRHVGLSRNEKGSFAAAGPHFHLKKTFTVQETVSIFQKSLKENKQRAIHCQVKFLFP